MSRTFDKFGHYRGHQAKVGPPGRGFVLDENGNYNMEEKVLTNLEDPEDEQDAVTKSYLKRKLDVCIQYDTSKGGFNCRRAKLFDIKGPEKEHDAVTLSFLRDKTINNLGDGVFDGKKARLRNIGDPQYSVDAVNLGYLKNTALCYKDNEGFDARGRRINHVSDPQIGDDGVNLNYLILKTLNCKEGDAFDGKNKRIKNVVSPIQNQDCVTLSYLKENTLNTLDKIIDARGEKITNLGEGENGADAVSLSLLIKIMQYNSYLIERDLTDAIIEIRREMFNLREKKYTLSEIKTRLNTMEGSFKRTWRTAVHADEGQQLNETEKKQIAKLLGIKIETIELLNQK